jgi:predicted metal-dependent hydrolase
MTSKTFKEEVLLLAKEVGVKPREIHIQSMKRKWASCSSRGRLTFDKKLLEEPKELRLEVILHELLHLKYPNHGRMFKSLLDTYLERSLKSVGFK